MNTKGRLSRILYSLDPRLPIRLFHQKERYIKHLFFKHEPDKIQLISLGNSYGYINIDFNKSPVPAFHLSNTGEDIFETKYKYLFYIKHLKRLKYIIFPMYYYLLFFDNSYHSKKRFEHRTVIYRSLSQSRVISKDYLHKAIVTFYSVFSKDPAVERLGLDFGVDTTNTLADNTMNKVWEKDALDFAVDNKVLPALNKMVDVMLTNDRSLHARAKQTCEFIINDALSRDIKVFAFVPPFYDRFTIKYRKEHIEMTHSFCQYLQTKYSKLSFIDFSRIEGLTDNHIYFRDVDHLNISGREQFSELLFKSIFHGE